MSTRPIKIPAAWPKRFFGLPFIEIFERLGKFDTTENDVEQIIAFINRPGGKILDVPCGFGRISGPLHQKGYQVTGIDTSEYLLSYARERFPGPVYHNLDMRIPIESDFDAVLNLWTSFGYFDDRLEDRKAVKSWYGALKPGGVLIMEYSDLARAQAENPPGSNAISYRKREQNGVVDEVWISWADQIATTRYTLGSQQIIGKTYIYSKEELLILLTDVGFESIESFGGFDKRPKRPSDRLVLYAHKPDKSTHS